MFFGNKGLGCTIDKKIRPPAGSTCGGLDLAWALLILTWTIILCFGAFKLYESYQ